MFQSYTLYVREKFEDEPLKKRLSSVFKALSQNSYIAQQDFWCCKKCAHNALSKYEGQNYVFYTQIEGKVIGKTSLLAPLFVSWKGNPEEIIKEFNKAGFDVLWNQSEEDCLIVIPDEYPLNIEKN